MFFFDTTLRDGEQSPGCSMTIPEKLRMAHALEALGVDIMEAGFAIASPGDFAAISNICREVRGPRIASLARARSEDIQAARARARRSRPLAHPRISRQLRYSSGAQAEDHAGRGVGASRARRFAWRARYVDDVEFSPEDATRSDPDFLCRWSPVAIEAGATVINLPDTVGYCVPNEYGAIFRMLRERVPQVAGITLSSHCHNDLGMAVANSLAALEAGARQIECTINGIGERAGNAALEEIGGRYAGAPGQISLCALAGAGTALPDQPVAFAN